MILPKGWTVEERTFAFESVREGIRSEKGAVSRRMDGDELGEGVKGLKNYVKAVLYAYPLLKTVEKDYEEHITNKALLSYIPNSSAESMVEKIAKEIVEMRNLEWLKGRVEEVLRKLTDLERELIAARYFGKRRGERVGVMAERTYFRRQGSLGERVGKLLALCGLTEEVYLRDYAPMELFVRVEKYLVRKEERKGGARAPRGGYSPSVS